MISLKKITTKCVILEFQMYLKKEHLINYRFEIQRQLMSF